MTADEARLKLLENQCKHTVRNFEIRYKNESFWQKVIGILLFFNRGYMTRFISTFYPRVYWPNRESYWENFRNSFEVLAHEWIHLLDDQNTSPGWFGFSYLSVQVWAVISVFALLAIWFGPWFLFFLAGLLFLAPWPSPWRVKWEVRGYAMSMAIEYWTRGVVQPETVEWVAKNLTGSSYYFPAWSKRRLWKRLGYVVAAIESDEILTWSEAFREVKKICQASDRQVIDMVQGS